MQRMGRPLSDIVDSAARRDQRLTDHLAAEDTLPALLRRAAAKQVHLKLLEIEKGDQILDGSRHRQAPNG